MLLPKKVKHRKHQKGRLHTTESARGTTLSFGAFGLKAIQSDRVTSRQIEAARRAMTHFIQRGGKIWIRIFPDKPITKKSGEQPMGKGKGDVDHFVAVVQKGRVLVEIDGVTREAAREALRLASHKFPVKTRFIERTGGMK